MKTLRILTLVILILLLIEGFGYVNSMVSYKHEVDIMTTVYEVEGKKDFSEIEARKKEIKDWQRRAKVESSVLFALLLFAVFLMIYKSRNK